jgi:hypothetical protein
MSLDAMAESKSLSEIKSFTSSSTHFIYLATKTTSHDPSPQDALAPCIKAGQEANAQPLLTKLASTRSQLATTITTINEAPFERTIWAADKQVDTEVIERELRAYLGVVKGFSTDLFVQVGSSAAATTSGEETKADEDTPQSTADDEKDATAKKDGCLSDLLVFLDWKDLYSEHPAMFVTGSDMEQASATFATAAALLSHVCRIGDGICREDSNVSEEIVKRSYKMLLFAATLFEYADDHTKKCTEAGSKDRSDMLCTSTNVTLSAVFKDLCIAQAQEITLRQGAAGRTNPQMLSEICSDSHSKYVDILKTLKSLPASPRHSPGKQTASLLNQLRAFSEWKAQYYKALCLYYVGLVGWAKDDAEGCGESLQAFKQSIAAFESLDKSNSSLDDYTFVLPQGEEREKRSELARKTVATALKNTIVCKDVAEGRNRMVYNELVRDEEVPLPEGKSPLQPLEAFKEVEIDDVWTDDVKGALECSVRPSTKKSNGCCIVL